MGLPEIKQNPGYFDGAIFGQPGSQGSRVAYHALLHELALDDVQLVMSSLVEGLEGNPPTRSDLRPSWSTEVSGAAEPRTTAQLELGVSKDA